MAGKKKTVATYLEILLPVEHDAFGLNFSVLDIDLVAAKYDRNVFADPD